MDQKEDPRITALINATTHYTVESILIGLRQNNLVEPVGKNGWQLSGELTPCGYNQIVEATYRGIAVVLRQTRISLPSDTTINENLIAASLIENAGLPQVRKIKDNELEINFIGQQPLIKRILSYLDPEKENAKFVKETTINQINLLIEPSDLLN